jgi:RNA polymerase sigma factor (sigma-70 family)
VPGSYSDFSLEQLQSRFAEGDRQAADELLRRHEAHLRACAWKWSSRNNEVAEEAYGELGRRLALAVARAGEGARSYRPEEPWLPWARRILKNAVFDELRRQARAAGVPLVEELPARGPADRPAGLAAAVWAVLEPLLQHPGRAGGEGPCPAEPPSFCWLPLEAREEVERFFRAFRECLAQLRPEEQTLLADYHLGGKKSHEHGALAAATVRQRVRRIHLALVECVSGKVPGVCDER